MRQSDIAKIIARERTTLNLNAVADIVNLTFDVIKDRLANGEQVSINHFGNFKVNTRAEHNVTNPRTREKMIVPAHNVVRFVPAKRLKVAVNGGVNHAD